MFWNIFKPKVTDEQIKKVVNPLLTEMEERVNWLQSMQKLEVKDGDIIVLRYPRVMSKETGERLCASIKEIIKGFGFNVKGMVLEEGMDIGVLRKEVSESLITNQKGEKGNGKSKNEISRY